ncbi:lipoprotein [Deltaproteobacteria bacterium]|nr:lipoprotein [Deltaproteobacteria bacterium]
MQRCSVFLSIFFLAFSLSLAGCRTPQTVKDAWKGTRSYYYEYLNTPAMLDFNDKGGITDYQAAIGEAIADFDMRLQELERAMQNSDRKPDAEWVTAMTKRFPWISGIALTDENGIPRAKVPTVFPKPFEIGSLLDVDPKQQIKDLRAFVQENALGPEIYLGNPVYLGGEFKGVITVHFDPRVLLARTGDPGKVMIAGPKGIIWPGAYDPASTPLANVDWAEMVRKNYSGKVTNERGAFYWICRYFGNLPLIYAIRIEGNFPTTEKNMLGLAAAETYAIGQFDINSLQTAPEGAEESRSSEFVEPPVEISPDGSNSPLTTPDNSPDDPDTEATPLAE